MRLLIVKTSSMGDVVHALPVVHDIVREHPQARIEWLVEAPFAAIASMHPGVAAVLPMAWRKWRRELYARRTWHAMAALRARLRSEPYDLVLDLQGLLKSALWARQALGPTAGYDAASAREPLAARLYRRRLAVPRELHAVRRCRLLVAGHLGLPAPDDAPVFGLEAPAPGWMPRGTYSVLIPNASRPEKLWPERHWIAVGRRLSERGLPPVVLWGRHDEQTLAERIAAGCDGDVPPFLKVGEMASVLARAEQVVGLDTGFTHLAAAFGRPTLGVYCDHEPGLAGITGPGPVASIGGRRQVPGRSEVLELLDAQMALREDRPG
ncbi:MAG TPA: lipopolysaccharide heptosyltransferase I [Rubrivivax sp.]|nr:lipopolysaccharide heptosyltransferase I [Rubrivivax sp.]